MKIKLRIASNARPAIVAPPVSSREITGEANPVRSFGSAGNSVYTNVIPADHSRKNEGIYTPPPKNPIWTTIPKGMIGGCKGC
jgi:hypothetical protein